MPSKLDPHIDEIRRLALEENWSVEKIGRKFGTAKSTMSEFMRKHEIRKEQVWRNQYATGTITPPELHEVPEEVSIEEKLRDENRELRSVLRRNRTEDVREARVRDTITEIAGYKMPKYTPRLHKRGVSSKKAHTLVLMWSDLHAGEIVSQEETRGLGEYDWDIMLNRHDQLREKLLSWRERFEPVEHLVLAGLGDMVTGDIHDELRETNEMPLDECVVQLALDMAEWVETLVPEFPKITIPCVVGNHGRREKKPRMKRRYSQADWQMYHFMAQRLRGYDSVEFQIPRASRHLIEVYGRRLLLMHGDSVPSSSMVGVPWGGIIRYSEKLARSEKFDHILMGHFHEPNAISKRIFVNGSIKGPDEYILERHGTGSPAAQLLLPFHPDHGINAAAYIDLNDEQ